jgi:ABC-type lipoprotein export system ATPase subunit
MSNAPITTRKLDHYLGTGDARKQANFDINLQIERGSLTILTGPSGSGKTTLLTLIGCLSDVRDDEVMSLVMTSTARARPYLLACAVALVSSFKRTACLKA